MGLYDADFARSVFWWWGEYALQARCSGEDIAKALGTIVDLADGKFPTGFVPPSHALTSPYIKCRRSDDRPAGERASVRDAATMMLWADADSRRAMKDDSIEVQSRIGTVSYKSMMAALRPDYQRSIGIDHGAEATITNKFRGPRALMFFTVASDLLDALDGTPEAERADTARDVLGLVHIRPDVQQILVIFDSDGSEGRGDRGRPTVLDSGGNPRFLSHPDSGAASDPWGRTADLEKIPRNFLRIASMPERVCGPYPVYGTDPEKSTPGPFRVHFLGGANVKRGDVLGQGHNPGKYDKEYAEHLTQRWEARHGVDICTHLLAIL
ncbi:hypothetical protein [Sphingomonas crocodyli]|uniref:Uncharacterized protein n=1 Tax=Sphingomonas crocodyli TaxID=1979270 RepID=A0A437M789_9SPHN|nr:hypothetical protein [Sphingomonas crocodyli]RVT93463.1 hypothetical protein EOD43_06190 [Sphingomonas crocodyli]